MPKFTFPLSITIKASSGAAARGVAEGAAEHLRETFNDDGSIKDVRVTDRETAEHDAPINTPAGKIRFINDLTGSVIFEIIAKIQAGAIPAEWDGHELRRYIADKFEREATPAMRDDRARVKAYRNTVIALNL